jgi:hypothetical protein
VVGCGGGLVGCPPGLGYFVDLFKNQVENYVLKLVGKRRPRKVLVNMIYYPDQVGQGSWADTALGCLGYEVCPGRLQLLIRTLFEQGTRRIRIEGTEVVPVPLFRILDPLGGEDYTQRVEPSVHGGRKMARHFVDVITGEAATPESSAVLDEIIPLSERS